MYRFSYLLTAVYVLGGLSFACADEKKWDERSFVGNTRYTLNVHGNKETIKGEAFGTASVLYRRESIDLTKRPVIRWRWKIKNTYGSDINEQSRDGDDYPARVYVVVKTGFFPWQTLAVNYVWSSSGQEGDSWPSAYTDKSQMVAVQAGDRNVGLWINEKRNVVTDFKRLFGIDVVALEGYAVMVDGDNTGNSGTAWFSDIQFDQE